MAKGGQPPKNAPSPAMKAAWKLLDEGDVVAARRQARRLLAAPESPADAEEAKALLDRLKIPREAFLLAAAAATVLVLLVVLAIVRS